MESVVAGYPRVPRSAREGDLRRPRSPGSHLASELRYAHPDEPFIPLAPSEEEDRTFSEGFYGPAGTEERSEDAPEPPYNARHASGIPDIVRDRSSPRATRTYSPRETHFGSPQVSRATTRAGSVIRARACSVSTRPLRQAAAAELPLVDAGRPDIITATVKSATVRGKPTRPKRARTALASLAGE
jgi:hypothetical protein